MFDACGGGVGKAPVFAASAVDAIDVCAQVEARAAAMRFAAIAEVVTAATGDQGDQQWWGCDGWDTAAAQVGAALGIGAREASGLMRTAVALRDRLPKVAAVFAAGGLSARTVSAITWRTRLVSDEAVLLVDAALAGVLSTWAGLSRDRIIEAIDGWVNKFDPAAVLQVRATARTRGIGIGKPDDETGVASIWGALLATDAVLLDRALTELAGQVCVDDPRTVGQRRSDAMGVLATFGRRLTCQCDKPDCAAAGVPDARAAAMVVHVLTDAVPAAVADRLLNGEPGAPLREPSIPAPADSAAPADPTAPVTPTPAAPAARVPATCVSAPPVGFVLGGGVVPPALLADLVARGAAVRPVTAAQDLPSEPRYRPSRGLDTFVRMRAMQCTFPGCGRPATACDVDHTVPWPAGPTHPGNLSPKCRKHHLLKTFHGGPGGWADRQNADGSVVWTSPTGHTYVSVPGSRILFPDKITDTPLPTAVPVADLDVAAAPDRTVMMPRRRRTRDQDEAQRIAQERAANQADIDERAALLAQAAQRRQAQSAAEKSAPREPEAPWPTATHHRRPTTNDIPPPF